MAACRVRSRLFCHELRAHPDAVPNATSSALPSRSFTGSTVEEPTTIDTDPSATARQDVWLHRSWLHEVVVCPLTILVATPRGYICPDRNLAYDRFVPPTRHFVVGLAGFEPTTS